MARAEDQRYPQPWSRVVPELQREDIREVLLRTYRIVYRARRDAIHVLTVF